MRQRAAVAAISLLLGLVAISPALAKSDHRSGKATTAGQAEPRAEDDDEGPTTTTVDPDDTDTTDDSTDTTADTTDTTDDSTDTTADTTDTSMPDDDSADDDSAAADDDSTSSTSGTTPTTSSSSGTATTSSTATTATTGTTLPPTTGTTGTTVTTMAKNTCEAPQVTREPAPGAGEKKNYLAGTAGDVDIERVNDGELRIASFAAADGWTAEVTEPSGTRVAVRFKSTADPKNIVKFNASLNTDGSQIVVRVLNCRSNEPDPAPAAEDDKKSATKP